MSDSIQAEVVSAAAAFSEAYVNLLKIWNKFTARYEFRGLLKDMSIRVDLQYGAIVLYGTVPLVSDGSPSTISVTEKFREGDVGVDIVVYRAIRRLLLHEAAECFFVSGEKFDDPHAHEITQDVIMSDDVALLERLLAAAKKKQEQDRQEGL